VTTPAPRLRELPQTTARLRLEAARPWAAPAHPGDLLRRAWQTQARRVARAAGWPALVDGWLDPRGSDTVGSALRLRLDRGEDGLVRAVDIEWRLWGAPEGGLQRAAPLLVATWAEVGRVGLTRDQVPHALAGWSLELGVPLSTCVDVPPRGPLVLQLHSPLSLDRDPGPGLVPTPAQLFSSATHRLLGLRRQHGLGPGRALAPPGPSARLRAAQVRRVDAVVRGLRGVDPVRRAGVVGSVELEGALGDLPLALALCSALGLGRGLSSGHGWISVVGATPAPRS
jgi:hypothetical protein